MLPAAPVVDREAMSNAARQDTFSQFESRGRNILFSIKGGPVIGFKRFAIRHGDGVAERKLIQLRSGFNGRGRAK